MNDKYEFVGETVVVDGHRVQRIRALKDLSIPTMGDGDYFVKTILKGDFGGLIEKEENLCTTDTSWVDDNTVAYGTTIIENDSLIEGKCIIGDSHIKRSFIDGRVYVRDSVVECFFADGEGCVLDSDVKNISWYPNGHCLICTTKDGGNLCHEDIKIDLRFNHNDIPFLSLETYILKNQQ